jgi:hypothetical protein
MTDELKKQTFEGWTHWPLVVVNADDLCRDEKHARCLEQKECTDLKAHQKLPKCRQVRQTTEETQKKE